MSQDATAEPAVNKYDEPDVINIVVVSPRGDEVFFKIRCSTKIYKLQEAFASKIGKDVATFRLLYDGKRINEDDTPASLEMEEGDTIDVKFEQTAGGYETT